ncbi:restriction endonuclease [Shinella sumterensis]|uniref:Restriction endonuclease n=1 Tax=Shinella sumterensis TaxID=1967501 RepID=A0AA50CQG3_9HYPH|nr:restriction endonuclease [Shinella sumterensis]WLR98754.1 restriction endonuclease [Shinella sumterensis]
MVKVTCKSRHLKAIKIGEIEAKWSANGQRILRYSMDFWHTELGLHKQISAPEIYLLEIKVGELLERWDKLTDEHHRKSRLAASKEACEAMTIEAGSRLAAISKILERTLSRNDRVDWDKLKDRSSYPGQMAYQMPKPSRKPIPEPILFEPTMSFWDTIFGRRSRKRAEALALHLEDMERWRKQTNESVIAHNIRVDEWRQAKEKFEAECRAKRDEFLAAQAAANAQIDQLAQDVRSGDPRAVIEHANLVLDASDYGGMFEKSYELDYQPTPAKILQIEYELPSIEAMPTVKTVRFSPSTGEMKETHLSEKEQKANFDSACYQICLRTLHELFEADEHGNLEAILFNGFSTSVNRATGKDTRSCIMSVLVRRADFEAIDLSRVDPKACFKSLRGVSASSLAALAPIAPVMEMNKQDKRFIDAKEVIANIDTATNLAAMDWSDFEHLIRELFEREFASRDGEVKITQSSSDGGVDAVAFDPDPITGGKIVIQAKRYTRTVGVSAVRDLFGTMQHEGASRGILISTADYGPDAHQFASGKPISLFSGSHLLHLLQKHGYNAKIDLQAARKELSLRTN